MPTIRTLIRSTYRMLALATLLGLFSVSSAQAQQGGGTTGGTTGGTSGGTTGGGGGGTGLSGLQDADAIFSDGIQRSGGAVQRQIGAAPGNAATSISVSSGGRGAGGLFGGLGGLGGFGGLSSLFGGNQQTQRTVRTRLVSRIVAPTATPMVVQSRVQNTFTQIAAKPRFSGIQVEMDGGTAVLKGAVASADDKRMAYLLVQLEPGVREVRNELEITP